MADIDKLIEELQQLTAAIKGGNIGNPPRRSRESRSSSSVTTRTGEGFEDSINRENSALEDKLKLLQQELEYRGQLSDADRLEMAQLEQRRQLTEQIILADTPERKQELLKELDNLTEAQANLNTELDRGSGQFEMHSTKGMFQVDGRCGDSVASSISRMTAERAGKLLPWMRMDFIKTGKILSQRCLHKGGRLIHLISRSH